MVRILYIYMSVKPPNLKGLGSITQWLAKGFQPPFLRQPPLVPAFPPFLKYLFLLPAFLFHPLLSYLRQFPPPSRTPPLP